MSNVLYPRMQCLSSSLSIYCNRLLRMSSAKHYSTCSDNNFKDGGTVDIRAPEGAILDYAEGAILDDVADQPVTSEPGDIDLSRLTTEECRIHQIHQDACKANQNSYIDPATGYTVLTRTFHIRKGKCCGNACRHCPYNHKAVPEKYRTKKFNSSFFS